ncbi:MAG: hypothetical protein ACOYMF_11260 [Bacteroidales bacterium]
MGFEDIFENKQRQHINYRDQKYPDNSRYSDELNGSDHEKSDHQYWLNILQKIKGNKRLKLLVIGAVVIILIIATGLIIAFLPLILKLIEYISQNGLQGLINEVTVFIDKIWKGSVK